MIGVARQREQPRPAALRRRRDALSSPAASLAIGFVLRLPGRTRAIWELLLLAPLFWCGCYGFPSGPADTVVQISRTASVSQTIDGDTIVLEDGDKVRLLGVDAPEAGTPCADAAAAFTSGLVLGREVQLEFDIEKRDVYGRLLAYVYVGDLFVNGSLVKSGYARPVRYSPNVKYAVALELIAASGYPPFCGLPLPPLSADRLCSKAELVSIYRRLQPKS